MERIAVAVLVSLLSTGSSEAVMANTKQPLDLTKVYQLALSNDPELRLAQERLKADRQVLAKARSGLLPSLSVSAGYARVEQKTEGINGFVPDRVDHFPRKTYQARLSQPLFNLENWHQFQSAQSKVKQAQATHQEALQDFRFRVVESYFKALKAQTRQRTKEAELDAVLRHKQQVERQLKAGTASRIDVQEIRAEARRVKVALIRAEGHVDERFRELTNLAGRQVQRIQPLGNALPIRGVRSQSLEQWSNQALNQNPTLQKARMAKRAARQNTSSASAARYPQLSLNLDYQSNTSDTPSLGLPGDTERETNTASVTLQLNMPLYNGGRLTAEKKEAWHRYGQAQQRYRRARQTLSNKLATQFRAVRIQGRAILAARQALKAQELALTAARKGQNAGIRDLVDLVRARRKQFTTMEVLNDARFDLILALSKLHRLGGSLDGDRITWINRWVSTS